MDLAPDDATRGSRGGTRFHELSTNEANLSATGWYEPDRIVAKHLRKRHKQDQPVASCVLNDIERHGTAPENPGSLTHTIFEGTSEIRQLVIARAISGLRIE